jgi:hypothetical protein
MVVVASSISQGLHYLTFLVHLSSSSLARTFGLSRFSDFVGTLHHLTLLYTHSFTLDGHHFTHTFFTTRRIPLCFLLPKG